MPLISLIQDRPTCPHPRERLKILRKGEHYATDAICTDCAQRVPFKCDHIDYTGQGSKAKALRRMGSKTICLVCNQEWPADEAPEVEL
jgi:hypothetical protein